MSAVRPSPTTPGTFLCPRCGNTLRDDQAWCLECGLAARTRVHPPPRWRIPIALSVVGLALLAAGIALALVTLLDTPESAPPAATVTVTTSTAAPPGATTPAPGATTPPATTPATPLPPSATTPTTAAPGATTSRDAAPSAPSDGGTQRTFTIPGTSITLPANAD